MFKMVLLGAAAIAGTFMLLMIVQTARLGSTERAARSLTSSAPAVTLGATTSGIILATDALLALIGFLFAFPDLIVTSVLGFVGYLSLEGVITIQPETWGILVIIGFAGTVLMRGD